MNALKMAKRRNRNIINEGGVGIKRAQHGDDEEEEKMIGMYEKGKMCVCVCVCVCV